MDIVSIIKKGIFEIPFFRNNAFLIRDDLDCAQEECAELIIVLSKMKRYPVHFFPNSKEHLVEEMSHVLLHCARLADIFDIKAEDIENEIERKWASLYENRSKSEKEDAV